jgi:hypothetical protein
MFNQQQCQTHCRVIYQVWNGVVVKPGCVRKPRAAGIIAKGRSKNDVKRGSEIILDNWTDDIRPVQDSYHGQFAPLWLVAPWIPVSPPRENYQNDIVNYRELYYCVTLTMRGDRIDSAYLMLSASLVRQWTFYWKINTNKILIISIRTIATRQHRIKYCNLLRLLVCRPMCLLALRNNLFLCMDGIADPLGFASGFLPRELSIQFFIEKHVHQPTLIRAYG